VESIAWLALDGPTWQKPTGSIGATVALSAAVEKNPAGFQVESFASRRHIGFTMGARRQLNVISRSSGRRPQHGLSR